MDSAAPNSRFIREQIRAVVFDLDGTLYDHRSWLRPAVIEAASGMGLDPALASRLAETYVDCSQTGSTAFHSHLLLGLGQDASEGNLRVLAGRLERYRPLPGSLKLFPGVRETIGQLAGRYKLGLITTGPPATEETKLNALGLRPYFDNIALHDASAYQRSLYPVGEALRTVLGRLSIAPGQCLFVADNPFRDFIAARDAGALSARTYEGHYADSLYPAREYCADFELSAVAHLPELMRGELQLLTPFPLPHELFTGSGPLTQYHTLLKYW